MELKVINEQGQEAAKLQASDELFGRDYNESLVHQVVVAYQANARSGDRKQKGRSEIAKSTKKPWAQKGTGRARAGRASSPLWRGGGKAFPNTPDENFSQKLNRKMYRAGMASILSELARQDRLSVVESLSIEAPKTKLFAQKFKGMGCDSVLVVTADLDENTYLASRNLPNVLVLEVNETDPVSLIRFPKVLMTKSAVAKFEEILG
ncbi:MAG: large subunit ribosomal protein [Pseudomonadota bacterium]|nr:large subunit ribosomal protein [Pseudomonadota bacterium]